MRILFINPPLTDFTQPCLSIPTLVGYLNQFKKFEIIQSDMNVKFFDNLFSAETMKDIIKSLSPEDKDEVVMSLTRRIIEAKKILRDKNKFYEMNEYLQAMITLKLALKIMNKTLSQFSINDTFNLEFTNKHKKNDRFYYKRIIEEFTGQKNNVIKKIIDKLIESYMEDYRPDVLCISNIYDSQNFFTRYILTFIKANYPNIVTVVGGTAITEQVGLVNKSSRELYEEYFCNPDFICRGYGEYALFDLFSRLMENDIEGIRKISNIAYVNNQGEYWENKVCNNLNFSDSCLPEYNISEFGLYFSPEIVLPVAPTRGCYWGRCRFCNYGFSQNNKSTALYMEKESDTFVREIAFLNKRYCIDNFMFFCDVVHPEFAEKFSKSIAEADLHIYWGADFRLEKQLLNEGRIQKYSKSGLIYAGFGMESCSQDVLNLMNKGTCVGNFHNIIKEMSDEGICVDLMLFSNFPKESPADYLKTLQFLDENKDYYHIPIGIGTFTLLKNTFVERNAKMFDISIKEDFESEIAESSLEYEDHNVYNIDSLVFSKILKYEEYINESSFMNERPWTCGSGTAHTFLYVKKCGKNVLKKMSKFYEGAMNISINLFEEN